MIPALLGVMLAFPVALAAQQQESDVVAAARKAREAKKSSTKAKFVFTNDNIPHTPGPGLSVVSSSAPPSEPSARPAAGAASATDKKELTPDEEKKKDEADWRKKFSEARSKLATAEKELDILQRELNLNRQQYYSDPNKTLREEYTRGDVNKGKADIDAKRKEVEQLRTALTALEDELRRAGGPAAWARP
jgi:DNA repair exonuclease SbcCD ATPase subunit